MAQNILSDEDVGFGKQPEQVLSDEDVGFNSQPETKPKAKPPEFNFMSDRMASPFQSQAMWKYSKPADVTENRLAPLAQTPEQSQMLSRTVADINTPSLPVKGTAGQVAEAAMSPPKSFTDMVQIGQEIQQNNKDTTAAIRDMAEKAGKDPDKFAKLPSMFEDFMTGFWNASIDTGVSVSSPAALFTFGRLPAPVQRMAALGFSAQMLSQFPEQAQQLVDEENKPEGQRDRAKIVRLYLNTLASGDIGVGAGMHGLMGAREQFTPTKTTPTTGEQNALQIGISKALPLGETSQDSGSMGARQIVSNGQEGVQAQEQGSTEAPQQDLQSGVKTPVIEPQAQEPAVESVTPLDPQTGLPIESKPISETRTKLAGLAKGMIPVRTAKSAADLSQTAVEAGFEELPEDEKAKYSPTTKASQIRKVSNLIGDDIENARAIVRGEKPVPSDIKGQVLWNAMEKIAMENSDVGMINELAKSPLAAKRSISAQELGASAFNQNPHSPVEAVREITEAREKDFQKKTGQVPEVAKKRVIDTERDRMNGEIKSSASRRPDWSEFIQSIACRN